MPLLKSRITQSSILVSDASYIYFPIKEHFKRHEVMSRGGRVFRRGIYHKNTIEGFFSQFKRAIMGQYHSICEGHLQLYLDELCFKYNHRNVDDKGYGNLLQKLINSELA